MTHEQKKTMARRMLSKAEIRFHTPIFESAAWKKRKENKAARVHNRETSAQYKKNI